MSSFLRTALLLATILDVPLLKRAVERLTDEPSVGEVELNGVRCLLARPGEPGPWPAVVFTNAAQSLGSAEPHVQRFLHGLGRAGLLAVAPDLPGLSRGEISTETLEATVAVVRSTAERKEARGGRVTLVGASTGAALALVAAADPRLDGRVSAVFAIAPFARLENVLRLATTGFHAEDGELFPHPVDPWLACAAARSLAGALPPGADRDALLLALPDAPVNGCDPLAPPELPAALGPQAQAVAELLANRDPRRFDRLYAALPACVQAAVQRLSPLAPVGAVAAPVELASAPTDRFFPLAESRALACANADVRLTVTSTLDHVSPRIAAGGLTDLVRFVRLLARFVEATRGPGS